MGLGPGDSVAILMRNDFAFFEASLAAQSVGAYATPINWHFTSAEVAFILNDCGAKLLVAHADLTGRLDTGILERVRTILVSTPPEIASDYGLDPGSLEPPPTAQTWDSWLATTSPLTQQPAVPTTSMIYTSGTTGAPKGVRRSPSGPDDLALQALNARRSFGLSVDEDAVVLMNGPMYHSAPNAYGLNAARVGADIVLQARFDPEEMLQLIEAYGVTHMHMVPTMFVRLLNLPESVRRGYNTRSLQFVVHGAAPCPAAVKRAMIGWWGPIINEYYGSTETGITVFHDSQDALRKPGTVGRALPGAVVKVFNDAGQELLPGPDNIGDLYMRAAGMPDFTYHGRAEERSIVGRGDLVTVGDVGWIDDDGYVFLCDRRRDMIISGGVNIYPAEIEGAFVALEGVCDCAVFGIPDDEFGEAVCAYIQMDAGVALTAEAVRSELGRSLARYKLPKVVEFREELPREDSGKIFKRRLREPYWANAGRNI